MTYFYIKWLLISRRTKISHLSQFKSRTTHWQVSITRYNSARSISEYRILPFDLLARLFYSPSMRRFASRWAETGRLAGWWVNVGDWPSRLLSTDNSHSWTLRHFYCLYLWKNSQAWPARITRSFISSTQLSVKERKQHFYMRSIPIIHGHCYLWISVPLYYLLCRKNIACTHTEQWNLRDGNVKPTKHCTRDGYQVKVAPFFYTQH